MGRPGGSFPSKFTYWVNKKFILTKIAGIDVGYCIKTKKWIYVYKAYYNAISEAHVAVSHGGCHKTVFERNAVYCRVPRFLC